MTYRQAETGLITSLQKLYNAGEANVIANWVMEELTGNSRWQRKQQADDKIAMNTLAKLTATEKELLQYKPVQYVLGYALFCGLKFLVNEAVLIPRPETEELVDWIVNNYQTNKEALQILDIGTGSGCIPIAIKKKMPSASISSVDISNEALNLAKKNAEINNAAIQFLQLDFLDEMSWLQLVKYDVIVSNPPYIPVIEKAAMNKNVTAWEPDLALFVPDDDPLLFYRKIAAFGKTHLTVYGTVFMETHQDYAGAVQKLFTVNGYETEVKKDINGNERMVKAVCK